MYGGITFRGAIEDNKRKILKYLQSGDQFTSDIVRYYEGDRENVAVRKALNELRKEGKVTTDDHVHMWQGKLWRLI
jgi:hypothetical protein